MNASGGSPRALRGVFFIAFLPYLDAQPPRDIRNVVKNV